MSSAISSRERVQLALNHKEADRVPIDINYSWQAYCGLREHLGLTKDSLIPDIWGRVWESPDLVSSLGSDCINIGLGIPVSGCNFDRKSKVHQDDYGVIWQKVFRDDNFYFEIIDFPIKEPRINMINEFDWPDPHNPAIYYGIGERIKNIHESTELAIITLLATHIWERAIFMCGYENRLEYLITEPEFCISLLRKIANIQLIIYLIGLDLVGKYTSILRLGGEDFGTQDNLLISPKMFKEIIKPILFDVYQPVKEKYLNLNPDGKIMFHSDGAIRDLIPDFINLGIDVLDPVQPRPNKMNGVLLKKEFGSLLVFHGGIDTQKILPFGTLEDVRIEVKRKIEMFAPGGGYILNPAHLVQSDVHPEKLVEMVIAAKEFGKYPILRSFTDQQLANQEA